MNIKFLIISSRYRSNFKAGVSGASVSPAVDLVHRSSAAVPRP